MIPMLLITYYFSTKVVLFYYLFNYAIALFIYLKATQSYFPNMKISTHKIANPESLLEKSTKQYFHEDYPAFNRVELSSLSFIWIYYGFLNYVWFKVWGSIFSLFFLYIACKIKFHGRDLNGPNSKEDKTILENLNKIFIQGMSLSTGIIVNEKDLTHDEKVVKLFREYLGESYNPDDYADKYTTIISNHISYADVMYIGYKEAPCWVAKASVKSIPLLGYIGLCFKNIFIDRVCKAEGKLDVAKQIENQQIAVSEGRSAFPICLYPEGTASNGRCLIAFKKGAFHSLTPVKSYLFKVDNRYGKWPLATGGMSIAIHMFITMTFLKCNLDAYILPVFTPTEYLFEHYKHLGKDKVEIYSEAMRRIIGQIGNLPLINASFENKLDYMSQTKKRVVKNT